MQTYFDKSLQRALTDFGKSLIGTEYHSGLILPKLSPKLSLKLSKRQNRKISQFPWNKTLPAERAYYILSGLVDQYQDIVWLIVETNAEGHILETKFIFYYDSTHFLQRNIFPACLNFRSLKDYFLVVKELVKERNLNFDEVTKTLEEGGLEYLAMASSIPHSRTYRNPAFPRDVSFFTSSIEHRAGFNLNPNWPYYIRLTKSGKSRPKLEFSINGAHWLRSDDEVL